MSEAIFDSAPIEPGLGPFAADDAAVWFTDFASLARYDVGVGEWASLELPVDRDRVGALTFVANGDGTASVLLGTCRGVCDDRVDTEIRWRAYRADAQGVSEVPGLDLSTAGIASAAGAGPDGAHFQAAGMDGDTLLVTVTSDRATSTDTGHHLSLLCVTGDGVLGLELVDDGAATVFAGPSADELAPVEPPSGAADALAGVEVSSSAVCTGAGLAVVGPELAWEFGADGDAAEVPSEAPVPPGRGQRQVSPAVTVDGVTWVAATGVNLRRDHTGWRVAEERPGDMNAPRHTGYGAVGEVLLAYPPADEPDVTGATARLDFEPRSAAVQPYGAVVVETIPEGPGRVESVVLIGDAGRTTRLDMPSVPDGQVWTGVSAVSVTNGFAVAGSLCTPYDERPSRCERTEPLVVFYDVAGDLVAEQRPDLDDTLAFEAVPAGDGVIVGAGSAAVVTPEGSTPVPVGVDAVCGAPDGLVGVTTEPDDPEVPPATYQAQVFRDGEWQPHGDPLALWTPLITPICVPGGVLIEDHFFDGELAPLPEDLRDALEGHILSLNSNDVVGFGANDELLVGPHTSVGDELPGVWTGWVGISVDRRVGVQLGPDGELELRRLA